MAIAFVQQLLTAQNKVASTSLVMSGTKTVTVGNYIIVTLASDPVPSAGACTDNLGNTYTRYGSSFQGSGTSGIQTYQFHAPITTGGALTTITTSWTGSTTAKAAVSCEYSGLSSTVPSVQASSGTGTAATYGIAANATAGNAGIFGVAVEATGAITAATSGTPSTTTNVRMTATTTGSGAATNIAVAIVDVVPPTTVTYVTADSFATVPTGLWAFARYWNWTAAPVTATARPRNIHLPNPMISPSFIR